jgi:galactokinase/mevalonate kinase-like predicted kinase
VKGANKMSGYCKDCGNQHCICEDIEINKLLKSIKLTIIKWLFGDMKKIITDAMQEQKRIDDKEKSDALNRLDEKHTDALSLQRQIYEAKVYQLESLLSDWKKKEKFIDDKEYKANMQIAINYEIAGKLINEAKTISGSIGKFQGLYDQTKLIHDAKIKEIGI